MSNHVLVAIDGSPQSWAAFDHALETVAGERITTLTVVDPRDVIYSDYGGGGYYDAEAHDRAIERAERLGEEARERVADAGLDQDTTLESVVETGRPARAIVDYAAERDVDRVVVGSHGRTGASRLLLGSVAETVARRAPVPVTIVR